MNEASSPQPTAAVNSTAAKMNAKINSTDSSSKEQAQTIAEAIDQMKAATNAIYQALGSMGHASTDMAKLKLGEGKSKAADLGHKAELAITEKPLMYVGIAFAAGWVISRLSRS